MKTSLRICLALFVVLLISCRNEPEQKPVFELVIQSEAYHLPQMTRYYVTQDSLKVYTMNASSLKRDSAILLIPISEDSLESIYLLNPKSYSCNEQHGLEDADVQFVRNDTAYKVNPGVNHPKELDVAVRIINAHVPHEYRLKFEDLQPAIFQTDNHSM
ncbi:MAG: hypothetical protein RL007_2482 [Bacteroidota bacterium]|jgi:hypothetical protein